jgi:colicin import membrane protein
MNKSIASKASLLSNNSDTRLFVSSISGSIVCHLVAFVILILAPIHKPAGRFIPAVINVDLVSLPSPVPEAKKPITSKVKVKISDSKPKKKTGKKVVLPSKKKIKRSLKKKTYKKSTVKKGAISRLEKDLEESRPDHRTKALDHLRDKVATTGSTRSGSIGKKGVTDRHTLTQLEIYKAEIFSIIQRNWVFSEQMTSGAKDLLAVLAIKIMPGGEIQDIWFEKKSGNRLLDDSAFKAIKKSDPLPALPKGVTPFYEIGVRFDPEGLR